MAKKAKLVKRDFPDTIYVRIEEEGAGSYLLADESFEAAEHGQEVARYRLIEVSTKRVIHELK